MALTHEQRLALSAVSSLELKRRLVFGWVLAELASAEEQIEQQCGTGTGPDVEAEVRSLWTPLYEDPDGAVT